MLAKELGPQNIRVNSINPGVIDTEGARAMETYEQVANEIKALTPLGRTGMPEDIGLIAALSRLRRSPVAHRRDHLRQRRPPLDMSEGVGVVSLKK